MHHTYQKHSRRITLPAIHRNSTDLLLDTEVIGLDLGVDSTLGLSRTVLVLEVLEASAALSSISEPDLVVDLLG